MKSTAIFRLESLLQEKQLDGTLAGPRLDAWVRSVSTGLAPLALAIAAATIAPRLRIGPFAPA